MGTFVGVSRFTDQDHADDAGLFTDNTDKWPSILANFDYAAVANDGQTSWTKTKLENVDKRLHPPPVIMLGNTVESTDCFTYLGNQIHSSQAAQQKSLVFRT